jgi:hypothetical protein
MRPERNFKEFMDLPRKLKSTFWEDDEVSGGHGTSRKLPPKAVFGSLWTDLFIQAVDSLWREK